jgi:hypothetical protein
VATAEGLSTVIELLQYGLCELLDLNQRVVDGQSSVGHMEATTPFQASNAKVLEPAYVTWSKRRHSRGDLEGQHFPASVAADFLKLLDIGR